MEIILLHSHLRQKGFVKDRTVTNGIPTVYSLMNVAQTQVQKYSVIHPLSIIISTHIIFVCAAWFIVSCLVEYKYVYKHNICIYIYI